MKQLLKILFILLVAVSLKPAAYHVAEPSDIVVVNTLDNGGVPVDDSMRAREQKVRIFPQYANQRQHYAADSRQAAILDRFSPAFRMPAWPGSADARHTLQMVCSFII